MTKTASHNPQKVFFYILFTLVESRFLFKNPPLAMIFTLKTVFYEILPIDGTNLLVLPFLQTHTKKKRKDHVRLTCNTQQYSKTCTPLDPRDRLQ
jgi:hypothetical protein